VVKSLPSELRVTGEEIYGEDATFELGIIIDCTGSMKEWIIRAKETLHEIIDKVVEDNKDEGNVTVRLSVVGYRDYTDKNRFMVKPFTENIDNIKKFINSFEAGNIGADLVDPPEDVQGAIKLMLMQDWTDEAIKRCVLICDMHCHGDQYHSPGIQYHEHYPAGTPFGFSMESLIKEMISKNISF